jgi:hypothetical protein
MVREHGVRLLRQPFLFVWHTYSSWWLCHIAELVEMVGHEAEGWPSADQNAAQSFTGQRSSSLPKLPILFLSHMVLCRDHRHEYNYETWLKIGRRGLLNREGSISTGIVARTVTET